MIIIPPKGMRNDLAYKLVTDLSFAHMWLCHAEGKCPDGCDMGASPKRAEVYDKIKVYHTSGDIRHYKRGWEDCEKGRQLFVRTMWGSTTATIDDDMASEWEDTHMEAYCDGWEAAGRQVG